ncbi:MAG TPA: hypothetical protein PKW33_01975 [Anaerolineaceae bacterium]|nr:hypothetical protein [Anaerolineaceae bacterium]HPN50327.1 hypothetical protein [Anaerolineaceae bacterium]
MRLKKILLPTLIILNLFLSACVYIVLPEGLETVETKNNLGWSGAVTGVSQTDAGNLHIDITIRNQTGDWSAMKAVEGKPALLTTKDGKVQPCETVFVGTGGHRLAPGFQMRGYTAGTKAKPETQLIYVECAKIGDAAGAELAVDYVAYSGELDYYHQDAGESKGTIKLQLDKVETGLVYPVYQPVDDLILKPDVKITALSNTIISLLKTTRTENGFEFQWQNENPTEFALKIHIGNPPVIGSDGIIYGYYEIMDLTSTPLTPAAGKIDWVTKASVPKEVNNCYVLLSVESKKMRLYVNYAIDITDK